MEVPKFLWYSSSESDIIKTFVLEFSLSLT